VHLKDTYWPSQERTAKEKHLTIPRIRAAQLRAAPRSARTARCGRRGIVCARIAVRAGKKPDASEGTSASPSRPRRDGRTDGRIHSSGSGSVYRSGLSLTNQLLLRGYFLRVNRARSILKETGRETRSSTER